jgi:two-component system, OmpR family, response regulator ResD
MLTGRGPDNPYRTRTTGVVRTPYGPVTKPIPAAGRHYAAGMARVLVVDDDRTVASVVASYLERAGHAVRVVSDGHVAMGAVAEEPPDLVVLDLMLPGLDGLEVCRRLRALSPQLPVVMLTALAEPDDRIAGLELGADDYVTKPFSPRELVLRIDSVLRRVAAPPPTAEPTVLTAGGVTVDPAARRATRDGTELALTVRELDLLTYLLRHPGQAFSREQLMRAVWGWTFGDQSTVTVHVRRLREKVETDPTKPALIHTVWGIGYRLEVPAEAPA